MIFCFAIPKISRRKMCRRSREPNHTVGRSLDLRVSSRVSGDATCAEDVRSTNRFSDSLAHGD